MLYPVTLPRTHHPKLSWDSARLRYTLIRTNNLQKVKIQTPPVIKIKGFAKKFLQKILKYQGLTEIKRKKVIYQPE